MTTYHFPYPKRYYSGTGSSSQVPSAWPLALAGRTYVPDTAPTRYTWVWTHSSIDLLKPQQDASSSTTEASLNPEGLWRRAQESFHHGAGQVWHDKTDADEFRFRQSKGIDPWTPYELTTLHDTALMHVQTGDNQFLETAGARLYAANAATLAYTTDLTTWTPVTGGSANTINGIASDGHSIYIANGTDGIHKTDNGISTAAQFVTGNVRGVIGYCNGRLMCSDNATIYNITQAGALPTALFTHDNADFRWVGFASGQVAIYAAGFSGDKSLVYHIGIKDDGTGLNPPIVAGELPDGEVITSIGSYLGDVFLGTTKGVRFCQTDQSGNLNISAVIPAPSPLCFEGQDKFVWFGWSNYDAESTGLGRLSVEFFTTQPLSGAQVPAYASDLMVNQQGVVQAVATFLGKRVFTVRQHGVYVETATFVSGTFDSGCFTFGIPDEKVALFIDVRCSPIEIPGRYDVSIATDDGNFTFIGFDDHSSSTGTQFATNRPAGDHFEVRLSLDAPCIVTRYTLKASSGSTDGPTEFIQIPLYLHRDLTVQGRPEKFDVHGALLHVKQLFRSHIPCKLQEGEDVYDVIVNHYDWFPDDIKTTDDIGKFTTPDGTLLVQLKVIN